MPSAMAWASASPQPSSSGSINEMGWLPPSLTASRCASVVLVQATNGKDGNHEYQYDDWCGSGKVCFPASRGVDERRDAVSTQAVAPGFFHVYGHTASRQHGREACWARVCQEV